MTTLPPTPRCHACGYDRRGLITPDAAPCPECGAIPPPLPRRYQPVSVWALIVVCSFACVAAVPLLLTFSEANKTRWLPTWQHIGDEPARVRLVVTLFATSIVLNTVLWSRRTRSLTDAWACATLGASPGWVVAWICMMYSAMRDAPNS